MNDETPTNALVYSKPNCPYCVRAKGLLDDYGIEYEEFVLDVDFAREEIILKLPANRRNRLTFPQIWVNEAYVGGCDDLEDYLE